MNKINQLVSASCGFKLVKSVALSLENEKNERMKKKKERHMKRISVTETLMQI